MCCRDVSETEKPKKTLPLFGAMKGGSKFKLKTGTIGVGGDSLLWNNRFSVPDVLLLLFRSCLRGGPTYLQSSSTQKHFHLVEKKKRRRRRRKMRMMTKCVRQKQVVTPKSLVQPLLEMILVQGGEDQKQHS